MLLDDATPAFRHPEIEQPDFNNLQSALQNHGAAISTSVDVLEIGKEVGAPELKYKYRAHLSHDKLVSHLERSKQNGRGPDLRIIFLKRHQLKSQDLKLDAAPGDNTHVALSSQTVDYLIKTLGVCPVFLSSVTTVHWFLDTGNALFKTFTMNKENKRVLSSIQGFFRYSDRGRPAHVWFKHNILEGRSTYLMHDCPGRVKATIEKWAKSPVDRRNLLRPLAVDSLIIDDATWAWSKGVVESADKLLKYEHYSKEENEDPKRIGEAVHYLYSLSQHFHILQEELNGTVEQLDYLLEVHELLSASSATMPLASVEDSLRYIRSRTHNWHRWVKNWKERTEIRIHLFFNLSTQKDNAVNMRVAQLTSEIATETYKDSSSMITIAALTLVFLPGTFTSGVFSMPFMQQAVSNPGDGWRLYLEVTLPLTLVVLVVWNSWRLYRNRQQPGRFQIGKPFSPKTTLPRVETSLTEQSYIHYKVAHPDSGTSSYPPSTTTLDETRLTHPMETIHISPRTPPPPRDLIPLDVLPFYEQCESTPGSRSHFVLSSRTGSPDIREDTDEPVRDSSHTRPRNPTDPPETPAQANFVKQVISIPIPTPVPNDDPLILSPGTPIATSTPRSPAQRGHQVSNGPLPISQARTQSLDRDCGGPTKIHHSPSPNPSPSPSRPSPSREGFDGEGSGRWGTAPLEPGPFQGGGTWVPFGETSPTTPSARRPPRSSSLGPVATVSSPVPPPTIRDRSGTVSGKVPAFQVRDGRTGRSRTRNPRPSQLPGPVRVHRSSSRSDRHKPSAGTHMYDRQIRSQSRNPLVVNRRRRRLSPEARGRSPSPIPRAVSIAYRTWSQRSRSHSPPRPPIVIQPQARRGSPAPLASPIRIPSPPPLLPSMVPMQYPQVASEIVSPTPIPIQNRESLRLRSIPNRGDTASPVRSGSPRIRIPYISRSPPPVQHSPPLVQRSPPPLAQSPPMMQRQYSESSTGSTLVNQNTFDLRQTRPLYGTWGSGSTLVQANPTKSDRDVLGFAEMSAPATPLFSYASPDDKLRATATPPDGKLPNV